MLEPWNSAGHLIRSYWVLISWWLECQTPCWGFLHFCEVTELYLRMSLFLFLSSLTRDYRLVHMCISSFLIERICTILCSLNFFYINLYQLSRDKEKDNFWWDESVPIQCSWNFNLFSRIKLDFCLENGRQMSTMCHVWTIFTSSTIVSIKSHWTALILFWLKLSRGHKRTIFCQSIMLLKILNKCFKLQLKGSSSIFFHAEFSPLIFPR